MPRCSVMANSFTAAPGEMPYDDDAYPDQPTNTICPECGARFWKGRDDSGGDLCDACADAEWMAEQDRRRRQLAARVEAEVERLQTVRVS